MSINLYEASNQWSTRPSDERFESLGDMLTACRSYADSSMVRNAEAGQLQADTREGDVVLQSKATGAISRLTHYAFGQLSRIAGGPADYLRKLPAGLAAECINTGLARRDAADSFKLLQHVNGSTLTRAITGQTYDRVWNHEVIAAIMRNLDPADWRTPPARPAGGDKRARPATEADVLKNRGHGLSIQVGDMIAPAGLYASDHDMFVFLVNETDPVDGGGYALNRGVFVKNSEVGDAALSLHMFTYDFVCGNHIVWNVGKQAKVSVRHIKGEFANRGSTLPRAVAQWQIAIAGLPGGSEFESKIATARSTVIAATKDDVLDKVFAFGKAKSLPMLTRANIDAAYDLAERSPRYGAPTTVWGMVNGLTEQSQLLASGFADSRNDLDVQAGRLLDAQF